MPADGAQCAAAPKGYPARDGRAVDEPRRKGGGGERLRIQLQLSAALASASSSAVHEWRINTVTRRTATAKGLFCPRPRNETGASDVAVMIQKFEPRSGRCARRNTTGNERWRSEE